ncbi:MAG: ribonuclease HII [Verrucomicrobia bacterium]|nr:MAG: ribonuclease HII [Verrucomicrobiota bacterium]
MPDYSIEDELIKSGYTNVAGIDEAGRGPLAGPVIAAAVILPKDFPDIGLNDSKRLSAKRREAIYNMITDSNSNVIWGFAVVDQDIIDEINILNATYEAMRLAALSLSLKPDYVIIDGKPIKNCPFRNHSIVKGDSKSLSISAASVIAKVERDRIMLKYSNEFPLYAFDRHKGYGTKVHMDALKEHGPCRIHRKSFAPVIKYS